ncbi:MAG: peptidoglycan-binding protein [Candidatus Nomurabacteria bacterium]|nr:peptidoglycan-binding protein [Candidatus Nomurabacteria bacterium]
MKKILVSLMVLGFMFSFAANISAMGADHGQEITPVLITRTLIAGQKGNDIKYLQQLLIQKGFLVGNADGSFGPKTKLAVMAFQKANNLFADGKFGMKSRAFIQPISSENCGFNGELCAQNNRPLVSCSPTNPASIIVTSPTAGQTFNPGQHVNVTWTNCNIPTNTHISIFLDGFESANSPYVWNSFASTGSYNWTVPSRPMASISSYALGFNANGVIGHSGAFIINSTSANNNRSAVSTCLPTDPASVHLIYPNGVESFDVNQNLPSLTIKISWSMCNIPTHQAKVELKQGSHTYLFNSNSNIVLDTPAAGPNEYANLDEINNALSTLSSLGFTSGGGYKIFITDSMNPTLNDSSDNAFSINFDSFIKS